MVTNPDEPIGWLTTREAAEILNTSEAAVRRRAYNREFPAKNVKGAIRLDRSAVEAAADSHDRLAEASAVSHDPVALVEKISGIRLGGLPMLLSPAQAAEILGCPRSTVYAMLRAGEIPCRMVGRTKRVPLPALIRWLAEREAA